AGASTGAGVAQPQAMLVTSMGVKEEEALPPSTALATTAPESLRRTSRSASFALVRDRARFAKSYDLDAGEELAAASWPEAVLGAGTLWTAALPGYRLKFARSCG
ncbi:unnamed protein product, partial [Polarella glacialis]